MFLSHLYLYCAAIDLTCSAICLTTSSGPRTFADVLNPQSHAKNCGLTITSVRTVKWSGPSGTINTSRPSRSKTAPTRWFSNRRTTFFSWVLRPVGMPIRFTEQIYNRSASLYSAEMLSSKYLNCENQEVLYIGKADGKKGLRQRLKQYMNYGWNNATNHKGGRAIWQIEDAGLLLLAYEECEARAREKQLLADYKAENGSYPLANWRG